MSWSSANAWADEAQEAAAKDTSTAKQEQGAEKSATVGMVQGVAVTKRVKDDEKTEFEEEDAVSGDWSVGLSYGMSMGIGAFVENDYVARSRARYDVGLSGSYTIPVIDTTLSIGTGFGQYLTEGGGSQEKYEFRWQDSSIGLSRGIWSWISENKTWGFNSSASLGFRLPTSRSSINANLYTSIKPGLRLGLKMGPVRIGYSIRYAHNFHKYTSVVLDPSDVDVLARNGGNEYISSDEIAIGGILTEMSLVNAFSVTYNFIPRTLSLTVSLAAIDSWSYDTESAANDEFTAAYADPGRQHRQSSSGGVTLSWIPLDFLSVSVYMNSSQPWKTRDNANYRFPWFDFEGPANNFTRLGFNLSFNLDSKTIYSWF